MEGKHDGVAALRRVVIREVHAVLAVGASDVERADSAVVGAEAQVGEIRGALGA